MLTTGDVAKLFNVSAQTVINWLEQGRLPFERIGNGPRRLTESNVLKYIHDIRISPEALDSGIYQGILHAVNGSRRQAEGPKVWVLSREGVVLGASEASMPLVGLSEPADVTNLPYQQLLKLMDASAHTPIQLTEMQPSQVVEFAWQRLESSQSGRVTVTPWFLVPGEVAGWVLAFKGSES